ncbi:hypothetical protein J3R04_005773 [Spirilliplanes yamanashiensis]|nr:hypothetical protein [Spirilliplanes yamanashiensis]
MHGDRGPPGQPAELFHRLHFDLETVDGPPIAVGNEHDETVVRNSGEHTLDDASCLIHARDDDDHFRFDRPDGIGGDDAAAGRLTGRARVGQRAGVQLDHPLQLVNPDRAEPLAPEGISQSHAARLPARAKCASPVQRRERNELPTPGAGVNGG